LGRHVMFIIEFFTADDPAKVDDTFARFVGEFLLAPLPKEARPLRREAGNDDGINLDHTDTPM
jgi:hypothetical protein